MKKNADTKRLLITKREAAWQLSVSVRTIHALIKQGSLASRLVGRKRLVLVSSLESFIKRDHPLLHDNVVSNLRNLHVTGDVQSREMST